VSRAIDLLRAREAGLPLGESHPDAPLACFPLRSDWERATGWTPEGESFPAPLHTSDQPYDHPAPKPISDLALLAGTHGWEYMITYAHGWVPHASWGTPSAEPKISWCVRLRRGNEQARAVQMDGKWDAFWTWGATEFFTRHGTLESFMTAVAGVPVTLPSRKEWDAMLVCYPKKAEWIKWLKTSN
jgi:hypothetical protein